jgi:hypothetical protein
MKAKYIFEFERGQNPLDAMNIGKVEERKIIKYIKEKKYNEKIYNRSTCSSCPPPKNYFGRHDFGRNKHHSC